MMEIQEDPHPLLSKTVVVAVVAGVVGLGLFGYAIHERQVAQSLIAENAQEIADLHAQHNQIENLSATVTDLAARASQPAPAPSAPPSTPASTAVVHRSSGVSSGVAHRGRRSEDGRFKKLQSELDAQGKAIEDTRNDLTNTRTDLTNTRTELTGSIARTHGELVVLEKKGERNYFEFDIAKSKQFQRSGQLGIRLRKANEKHQYADLELMVDDRNLSQKHVNLYQPIMFSTPDYGQPVELVINSINKNHIHGYVSTPKYSPSELADAQNAATNASQGTGSSQASTDTESTRQKLPKPQ